MILFTGGCPEPMARRDFKRYETIRRASGRFGILAGGWCLLNRLYAIELPALMIESISHKVHGAHKGQDS